MGALVSILIPTYNQSAFVAETVRSALEQSYENLQVVVADDASTDGTREILERLAEQNHGRLRLILGDKNLGITGNFNRALDHCDGEFVAMQGGDDILLPGKVEKQMEWFDKHPNGVLCYHDCEVFESESGEVICNFSALGAGDEGYGPSTIIRDMRLGAATSVIVRRDAIPDYGFDSRLPMVSDWKLQIDVLSKGGEYGRVDGVFARYRRHRANSKKAFPVQYHQDCLCTVAIVETEMLGFAKEARLARARIFGLMAIDHLAQEDRRTGLSLAAASMRQGLFSWKYPLVVILLVLPKAVRKLIKRLFAGKVRALNYLGA